MQKFHSATLSPRLPIEWRLLTNNLKDCNETPPGACPVPCRCRNTRGRADPKARRDGNAAAARRVCARRPAVLQVGQGGRRTVCLSLLPPGAPREAAPVLRQGDLRRRVAV